MPMTIFMRDPCLLTQETVRASLNSSDPAVMLDQSSTGEFHLMRPRILITFKNHKKYNN